MRVGFLINGAPTHGVVRYGRMLGEAAKRLRPDDLEICVTPRDIPNPSDPALAPLRGCDVLVLNVSPNTAMSWGPKAGRVDAVDAVLRAFPGRKLVCLHDVSGATWARLLAGNLAALPISLAEGGLVARLRLLARNALSPASNVEARLLERLAARGATAVFANAAEYGRALHHRTGVATAMTPHFIENRPGLVAQVDAKARLGLEGRFVVTILGFIARYKGHVIALDMLDLLPQDAVMVFAGGFPAQPDEALHRRVEAAQAREGDRLRVTGYIPDDTLDLWLSATDVAISPHVSVASSGSFATWLACDTPIAATDLEPFREYSAFASVSLVARPTPAAFAAEALRLRGVQDAAARAALRVDHSLDRSAERILAIASGVQ